MVDADPLAPEPPDPDPEPPDPDAELPDPDPDPLDPAAEEPEPPDPQSLVTPCRQLRLSSAAVRFSCA